MGKEGGFLAKLRRFPLDLETHGEVPGGCPLRNSLSEVEPGAAEAVLYNGALETSVLEDGLKPFPQNCNTSSQQGLDTSHGPALEAGEFQPLCLGGQETQNGEEGAPPLGAPRSGWRAPS